MIVNRHRLNLSLLTFVTSLMQGDLITNREDARYYRRQVQLDAQVRNMKQVTPDDVTKVLLVTYFRGGSTFLGEMFNYNHDAFYMFEPLNVPFTKRRQEAKIDLLYYYRNGTASQLSPEVIDDLVNPIIHIYNCDLHLLDWRIMAHMFYTSWSKSLAFLSYKYCWASIANQNLPVSERVAQCLPLAIRLCRCSNIRAIKSIRISGQIATILLTRIPDLKVVYYTRDPRGMLASQMALGSWPVTFANAQYVRVQAKVYCNHIRGDMETFITLEQNMTSSVMSMRYEDLALDPMTHAQRLYHHVRRPLPESVKDWILLHTSAVSDDGPMGTRRNSSKVVAKWRTTLPEFAKKLINHECGDVVTRLNHTL